MSSFIVIGDHSYPAENICHMRVETKWDCPDNDCDRKMRCTHPQTYYPWIFVSFTDGSFKDFVIHDSKRITTRRGYSEKAEDIGLKIAKQYLRDISAGRDPADSEDEIYDSD